MSVDNYCNLDLSPLAQDLRHGILQESSLNSIDLSSEFDESAPSAGLSPIEQTCYNRHIAHSRSLAISAVTNAAKAIRMDGDDQGIFDPVEKAAAQKQYNLRLHAISSDFDRKNAALTRDYLEKDSEYRKHKNAASGREAKTPNNLVIWGVLFPMVMIPEALLNFETFRKVPIIQSDAVALGITLLVALGIAYAAHLTGTFVRQFHYFSRAHDDARKNSGWPMLWIGVGTLLVCLAAVLYGRYFYLMPQIAQALVLGQTPPSVLTSLVGMLAGNLICFLLGFGFAFMLHDPNPEYEAAAIKRKELEKILAGLRRKTIDKPAADAKSRLLSDNHDIDNKRRVMEGKPAYAAVSSDFARIKAKDHEVISLLQSYRQQLAGALQQRGNFEFAMRDCSGNPIRAVRTISLAEYQTFPINLSYA